MYRARIDERRRAFILAAREILDAETLARIWARTAAAAPQAFVDGPITEAAHGMGGMSLAQARESGRVGAEGSR
ncbi:hypothetical protein [Methylobacterium sp. 17Sr1-1]|uniref:hypothetical protein n=1 Tax=Methylobacterium sp. 17Sr1-1 TaxID=2202826 RepID=UPI0013A5775C|nr:hypothetical protein [Methylobacterium sp. 17Sr1-1]